MSTSATGLDIYNYPRRLQLALLNLQNNAKISATNRQLILRFHEKSVADGLSAPRLVRYIHILSKLAEKLQKPFTGARQDDIIRLVAQIESQPLADWTKQSYKVVLRKFYKWLKHTKDYPEEVSWIKVPSRIRNNFLPSELLTEDEVKRLASVAKTPRNRALVLVLYESGCRIGELLSLRIRNVEFDNHGAVLIVTGKTGMRRVRVIMSSPSIADWLNVHPRRDDPDFPLWVGQGRGRLCAMKYEAVRSAIQDLAATAGVRKSVRPHMFRHSRATFLSKRFTEAQMDQYLGWLPGSKMHSVYVHLSGKDVDGALLSMYGLEPDREDEPTLKPTTCPRCKEPCSPTLDYCPKCASPTDPARLSGLETERGWIDPLMTRLLEDTETQRFLARKIRELRLFEQIGPSLSQSVDTCQQSHTE
jgi:integrase